MPVDTTNGPFYDTKTITVTSTGVQSVDFDNITSHEPKAVLAYVSGNTSDDTEENDAILGFGATTNDDRGFAVLGLKNNETRLKKGYVRHQVASDNSGKAWILGGTTPENFSGTDELVELDLSTGAYTALASPSSTVRDGTLTYYDDGGTGKLFLFGGIRGSTSDSNILDEYDIATDTWTNRASATTGVDNHSAVIYNDDLFVFGGNDGSGAVDIIQRYDITTNTWSTEDDGTRTGNPGSIEKHQAVVSGTKMYVHSDSSAFGTGSAMYSYDFVTQTWATLASSPTALREGAMSIIGNNIYVAGGLTAAENLLQIYSISGDSWSSGANILIPVSQAQAVTDGTDFYLIGGDADDTGAGYRLYPESKYIQKYNVSADSWETDYFDNVMSVQFQDYASATYSSTSLSWIRVPDFGNPSSSDLLNIKFNGFSNGSISIDVVTQSQNFIVTFVMIAGSNVTEATVGEVTNGGSASIGYEPDFVWMCSSSATANNQVEDIPSISFGAAVNRAAGTEQRSIALQVADNDFDLDYSSRDSVWHMLSAGQFNLINQENTLTFSGTGFSLSSTEVDVPTNAFYLALQFDSGVTEEPYYSRELIENGDQTANVVSLTGVGYKPGLVFTFAPEEDSGSSEPNSSEEVYSFSVFTENSQANKSVFISTTDDPSNSASRSVDGDVVNFDFVDSSLPISASLDSMDPDGFSMLFTDFNSSLQNFDLYFFALPGVSSESSTPTSTKRAVITIIT